MIEVIKYTAERLCASHPEISLKESVMLAVMAHNNRENIAGYSPNQWTYGVKGSKINPEDHIWAKHSDMTYEQVSMMRVEAENTFNEELTKQKLSRAMSSRGRPTISKLGPGIWVDACRSAPTLRFDFQIF